MTSHIGRQNYSFSSFDGFNPIVHKVGHDEEMDYLREHKPVADVLGQNGC